MHAETRSLSRPGHQLRLDAERFLATLVRANYIPDVVPAKPGPIRPDLSCTPSVNRDSVSPNHAPKTSHDMASVLTFVP